MISPLVYFNPYAGKHFWNFFLLLFQRLWQWITGSLPLANVVSDEIQIVILSCLAIGASIAGTFLVLRRMAMLANALSHTILLGIVIVYLLFHTMTLPLLLVSAILSGIVTTFLTEFLHKTTRLQEDASIGLIFSILFALGILLLTLFSRNAHIGTELIMGNVDTLTPRDLPIVLGVLGINICSLLLFYYGFKITSFDTQLAYTLGFSPLFFTYLLMVQTAATVIGSFKAVGVLMVLAFLVIPPLIARLLTHRLSILLLLSAVIGVGSSLCGVALSRHILTVYGVGISTAGLVVTLLGTFYLVTIATTKCIDMYLSHRYHAHSNNALGKDEENCSIG